MALRGSSAGRLGIRGRGVREQLPECTAVSPLAAGHSSTGSSMAPSFPLSLLLVTRCTTQQGPTESARLLLCQSHFPGAFEPHSFQTLFALLTLCMAFASAPSGVPAAQGSPCSLQKISPWAAGRGV